MTPTSIKTTPYSFSGYFFSEKQSFSESKKKIHHLKLPRVISKLELLCKLSGNSNKLFVVSSCNSTTIETPSGTMCKLGVSDRVQLLVSEFNSLTEPIDRVKRLLHYASMLAPFDESGRVPENRVKGCTTQVWLEVRIDKNGKVRFRADSDSEITKGFCSCLIWMMDGANPEEVVEVTAEDLMGLNVGEHGNAQSRVNTWQNVLISMRHRTAVLLVERQKKLPPQLRAFPSFLAS